MFAESGHVSETILKLVGLYPRLDQRLGSLLSRFRKGLNKQILKNFPESSSSSPLSSSQLMDL